jgi:hypothetical protein
MMSQPFGMRSLLLATAVALALAASGCGGGGGGSGSTTASTTQTATGRTDAGSAAGGSAQFRAKGGDNSIQGFGSEASPALRERAAASLHAYFDARVHGDWARACRYISAKVIAETVASVAGSSLARKGCAAVFAAIYASIPARNFADAAVADVGSFRVRGKCGFLPY